MPTETACLASHLPRSSPVRRPRYGQKQPSTSSTLRSEYRNSMPGLTDASESLGHADRNSMRHQAWHSPLPRSSQGRRLYNGQTQHGTSSTLRSETARYVVYATVRIRSRPVRRLRYGQKQPSTSSTLRSESVRIPRPCRQKQHAWPPRCIEAARYVVYATVRSIPVRRQRYGQNQLTNNVFGVTCFIVTHLGITQTVHVMHGFALVSTYVGKPGILAFVGF